jgi:hypothetical protein
MFEELRKLRRTRSPIPRQKPERSGRRERFFLVLGVERREIRVQLKVS